MNSPRDMKTELLTIYNSYKAVLICAVAVTISKVINSSEEYIIDHIILVSKTTRPPPPLMNYVFKLNSCPAKLIQNPESLSSQYSQFYWSAEENEQIFKIRKFTPFFTYVFTGILGDRMGGQRLMLVGLIISSTVIATQYLAILRNHYVFIVMVTIRRFGEGMVRIAWVPLAVQWARPDRRGVFIGIAVASLEIGYYIGYTYTTRVHPYWKHLCWISGMLGFMTVFWWWLVTERPEYKHAQFKRTTHIPWRNILTSKHFYVLITLAICEENVRFILFSYFHHLRDIVRYDITTPSLPNNMLVLLFTLSTVLAGFYFGLQTDFLIDRRLATVLTVRKFFLAMVLVAFAVTTLLVTCPTCSVVADLACCMIGLFFSCVCRASVVAINIDSAPLLAATLYGTSTLVGGLISTFSTLYLTKTFTSGPKTSMYDWNKIFYIMTVYTVFTAMPYLFCIKKERLRPKSLEIQRVIPSENISPDHEPKDVTSPPEDKLQQNPQGRKTFF